MPLYEYECRKCHARAERIEKHGGPHLKSCPQCKGRVERLVSRTAIQFKGSGWYVTDYARSGASSSSGDSSKAESAPAVAEKPAAASETKSTPKPAAAGKGKKAAGDR